MQHKILWFIILKILSGALKENLSVLEIADCNLNDIVMGKGWTYSMSSAITLDLV